jgi:hypothetical protein
MALWIMHTYGDDLNEEAHFDSKKKALEYVRMRYPHSKRITNREGWQKMLNKYNWASRMPKVGHVWIEKREDGVWSNME